MTDDRPGVSPMASENTGEDDDFDPIRRRVDTLQTGTECDNGHSMASKQRPASEVHNAPAELNCGN
ncbi:hypothetical protein [Nocardia brasiliensis]|uniref:hypothetical protein n=1 Tax=Nocardia brasiliensis TaxID=37326 RepID=UPI002458B7BE|nr:hypothetical protein [Nocardia brasiliensis]